MEKITLKLHLTDHLTKSSVFGILDLNGKLRPEILELLEDGIAKYFAVPSGVSYIEVKEHNESFKLKVSANIEYKEPY